MLFLTWKIKRPIYCLTSYILLYCRSWAPHLCESSSIYLRFMDRNFNSHSSHQLHAATGSQPWSHACIPRKKYTETLAPAVPLEHAPPLVDTYMPFKYPSFQSDRTCVNRQLLGQYSWAVNSIATAVTCMNIKLLILHDNWHLHSLSNHEHMQFDQLTNCMQRNARSQPWSDACNTRTKDNEHQTCPWSSSLHLSNYSFQSIGPHPRSIAL